MRKKVIAAVAMMALAVGVLVTNGAGAQPAHPPAATQASGPSALAPQNSTATEGCELTDSEVQYLESGPSSITKAEVEEACAAGWHLLTPASAGESQGGASGRSR
jgi:hypothetical protein